MPEQQTTTDTSTSTEATAGAATNEATAATSTATEAATTTAAVAETIDQLPEWAQQKIASLNRENAAARVTAKQQAAEEARNEILTKLGLVKGDEAPDPEALAKDLATARETAKETSIKLAVYQAAAANKANPDALLDSASFLAKVRTLDPNGADFNTQVSDAITAALTANPVLKATQAVGASGVDLGGGSGEQGQISAAQLKTMTPDAIVDAQKKGLLNHLLG